jgi:hypothetical protein
MTAAEAWNGAFILLLMSAVALAVVLVVLGVAALFPEIDLDADDSDEWEGGK